MSQGLAVSVMVCMVTCVVGIVASVENGNASLPPASNHPDALLTLTDLVLYPGEVATVPFRVGVAASVGPFVITSMRSSCRCFAVPALPDRLDAGRIYPLPITVVGYRAPGPMSGDIRVDGMGDGRAQTIVCSFTGRVHDYVEWPWSAALVDLGRRAIADPPGAWSFEMTRGSHPSAWDRMEVAVVAGGQFFSSTVTVLDAQRWTVGFSTRPSTFSGVIGARVRWSFWSGANELPYHPERSLRLMISGPVSAKPAAILVGGMTVGQVVERRITAIGSASTQPEIIAIHPSDPLRVTGQITAGGEAADIRFVAAAPAGEVSGHIDLDMRVGGTVRVPYYMAIQDAAAAPLER